MPKTLQDLRRVHQELFSHLDYDRRQKVGRIEQTFPTKLGVSVHELFGTNGVQRHKHLLYAAVWALHRPGHIHLPKETIARYLNLTEGEVTKHLIAAESAMIAGAGNPAHDDMMICFQYLGPTIARVLSIIL